MNITPFTPTSADATLRSAEAMLSEDLHIHSTFSDGRNTIEENIEAALARGLTRICCVDHVRRSTDWVPAFVEAVGEARLRYAGRIDVLCGIEAKFLDASGTLDLPDNITGVDYILAADHQLPLAGGIVHPRNAREALETGELTTEVVVKDLASAMIRSVGRYPSVILAHPFSILPKIGLSERSIPIWALQSIATAVVRAGARIEISERWTCPGPMAIAVFAQFGVDLCCSTDAHSAAAVGRYQWVASQVREITPTTSALVATEL